MFKNQIQLKKITFLIGFALVNEIGGNFSLNLNLTFPLYFGLDRVKNIKKHVIFSLRSKIIHTFYVFHQFLSQNTREKSKFIVSKYIATHFLHQCGNPSKKIIIFHLFSGRSTALRRPSNECFEELFINSTRTFITSPNYPLNYDNHVHCRWVLQTDR